MSKRSSDYRRRRELSELRLQLEKQQAISGAILNKRDIADLEAKYPGIARELPGLASGTPLYPGLRNLEKRLSPTWAPLVESKETGQAKPLGAKAEVVTARFSRAPGFEEVVRWQWIDSKGRRAKAPKGKPPRGYRQIAIRTRRDLKTGSYEKPLTLQPWTVRGQAPTEVYRLMVLDTVGKTSAKAGKVARWQPADRHDYRKPCQVALFAPRKDASGRARWVISRYLQRGATKITPGEMAYFQTMTRSAATPGRKWAVEASGASVSEALAKVNWGDVFEPGSVVAWAVRMRGTTKDGKPWTSKDLAEGVADNRQGGVKGGEDTRYNARDAKGYIIQDRLKGVFHDSKFERSGRFLVRTDLGTPLTKIETNVLAMAKTIRQAQRSWQVRTYDAKRLDVLLDETKWQPSPMVDTKTKRVRTDDQGRALYRETYSPKEAERTRDQWASFLELAEFRLEIMLEMIQTPYDTRKQRRKRAPKEKPKRKKR